MNKMLIVLLVGLFLPKLGLGQALLTLESAIEQALIEGPAARQAALQFEQSTWVFRGFRARQWPALVLNGSVPGLDRSINEIQQDDGSVRYVARSLTSSQVGLSVVQNIPWTGGQFFASTGLSRVEQFGDFDFIQWQSTPLSIGFTQPLFRFNALKWERRLAPLQFELAERAYIEDRAGVAVEVAQLFFEVYTAQINLDIAQFNVAVNDTIYTLSRGRYDIGKIAENDLLQSELALLNSQAELSDTNIDLERALQNLKMALNLPLNAPLEVIPPLTTPDVYVDPSQAVELAKANQAGYLNLELERLQAEQSVAQARSSVGASLDFTTRFGLNQRAESFDNVYANPLSQQQFGIQFRIPILGWGRGKAAIAAAETALHQTKQNNQLQQQEREQEVYFEAVQLEQLGSLVET